MHKYLVTMRSPITHLSCSQILPSLQLVKLSYLAFFNFLRYVEIFEVPHVFYLLSKVRKLYVLRKDL